MQGISKSAIPIAFGAGVAAFLGYCFWFDQKRRGAKDFKKKLHEKRQDREKKIRSKGKVTNKLPDLTGKTSFYFLMFSSKIKIFIALDHEAVQRYFLHEIQMGEALISQGDITNGVEHLANAVIVCGEFFKIFSVFVFLHLKNLQDNRHNSFKCFSKHCQQKSSRC